MMLKEVIIESIASLATVVDVGATVVAAIVVAAVVVVVVGATVVVVVVVVVVGVRHVQQHVTVLSSSL